MRQLKTHLLLFTQPPPNLLEILVTASVFYVSLWPCRHLTVEGRGGGINSGDKPSDMEMRMGRFAFRQGKEKRGISVKEQSENANATQCQNLNEKFDRQVKLLFKYIPTYMYILYSSISNSVTMAG